MSNEAMDVAGAADALIAKMEANSNPPEPEQAKAQAPEVELEASDDQGEEIEEPAEAETDEADSDDEQPQIQVPDDYKVKVKVNGEELEVPFAELRKGYMMDADYRRKTQEVSEARKAIVTQAQQHEAGIRQRVDEVGFLAQTLVQQLTEAEASTDWNTLRHTNPAEYVAKQHDIAEKRQLLGRAWNAYQQAQAQQAEIAEQQRQMTLAEQSERLNSLVPEWLDSEVATKEKSEVAKYLKGYGLTDDTISNLSDAVTVAISRKAMLWDKSQQAQKEAKNKATKNVPQFTAPGPRPTNKTRTVTQKAFSHAQRTGKHADFGAALAAKYGL